MNLTRVFQTFCVLLFLSQNNRAAAQQSEILYKLKSTGKYITKAQVDSMSKIYTDRMKVAYTRDGDKRIVEIDTLQAGETPSETGMQMSMHMPASRNMGAQGGPTSSAGSKTFRDQKGATLSEEEFRVRTRSGEFTARYEMKKNDDKYKVTYHLVPKTEAERKAAQSMREYMDKIVNSRISDFEIRSIDGGLVTPASLRGKTVVLNFWFINCRPCVLEMPSLNEVVNKYKDRPDIVFLAPALDDKDKIVKFLETHSFSYKQVPGAEKLAQQFGIYAYPTHLIVNNKGIIVDAIMGSSENIGAKLIDAIEKASHDTVKNVNGRGRL